jgi:hypothetical protein
MHFLGMPKSMEFPLASERSGLNMGATSTALPVIVGKGLMIPSELIGK